MRLLVDNNLSPRLVSLLAEAGWDVVHVDALGLRDATDPTVLATARAQDRVLLSADTDFGGLLAASHDPGPSVVLIRRTWQQGTTSQPLRRSGLVLPGDDEEARRP